jgi:tetratricopeptide (TPR) repeat protein
MKKWIYQHFSRRVLRWSGTDPDALDEGARTHFRERVGRRIEEYQQVTAIQYRIMAYHRILAIDPTDVQLRFLLGRDYLALGQADAARREWEKVLELDPDNIPAREALAQSGKGLAFPH